MANIARLGVLLGLDSAEFTKGLTNAKQQLEAFSKSVEKYATIGAVALAAMGAKALVFADEISDVAAANDVAIDSVIKLSNALANSGGKAEDAGKLLASFTKFVDSAAEGSFEAQKSFKNAEISLSDLSKLSTQDLFGKAIQGIAGINDPLTRSAKAMEIFGKAAKGVDFKSLADGMSQGTAATDAQAQAIKDAGDAYDMMSQNARNFTMLVATELGPVLKTTLEYMKNISGEGNLLGSILRVVFETIAVLGANVAFVFKQIALEISTIGGQLMALAHWDISKYKALGDAQSKEIAKQMAELDAFEKAIMNRDKLSKESESGTSADSTSAPAIGRKVKAGFDPEAAARKQLQAEIALLQQQQKFKQENFKLDMLSFKVGEEAVEKQRAGLRYAEDIAVIQKTAAEDRTKKDAQIDLINEKERQQILLRAKGLANENSLIDEKIKKLDRSAARELVHLKESGKLQIEKLKLENPFSGMTAFEKSVASEKIDQQSRMIDLEKQLADAADESDKRKQENILAQMALEKDLHKQRLSNLELEERSSQVDKLGENLAALGKYSKGAFEAWKAFQIAKTLIDTYSGAQSAFGALSGIPIIGPALGTAAAAAAIGAGMAKIAAIRSQSFQGRAKGGDISGGTPYMVGEKGPELIVPGRSGTVVPNHTLMDAVGNNQKPVVNNYTINAIDTKSFDDRLLASSNTIWAANMYANKGLATGRGRA